MFRSTDTATPFSSTTPGQVVEVVGRIGFNGGRQRLDITESLEKLTSPYGITVLVVRAGADAGAGDDRRAQR